MITYNINNTYTGYLGNRMFQAAATIGIAVKNGMDYDFVPNEYWGPFKNMKKGLKPGTGNFATVGEAGFGYQDVTLAPGRNYDIAGYRQSEKYFSHCRELVIDTFTFTDMVREKAVEILGTIKQQFPDKKIVSVHYRLGDYLNIKEHHTCLSDSVYYAEAVRTFGYDTVFAVFSDNVVAASEMFKRLGREFVAVETRVPAVGMCLMSMLDGHVIANSSYSWWGAYLSGKPVISPSSDRWFGPAYRDMSTLDIIPESWKQIGW